MTTEKDRTPLSTEVNGAEGEVGQRRLDGIDRRSTQCQSREERFPQLGSVRGCSILLAEPNHSQPVQQRGRGKDQKKRSRDVTVNTAAAACVDWSRHPLWAAAQLRGLHRRTRYRSVGTKDAAMTGLGLEWDAASGARVKVNARVGWHLLLRGVSASGAGENRDRDHGVFGAGAGGEPPCGGSFASRARTLSAKTLLSRWGNSELSRRAPSCCMRSSGRGGSASLHVASAP